MCSCSESYESNIDRQLTEVDALRHIFGDSEVSSRFRQQSADDKPPLLEVCIRVCGAPPTKLKPGLSFALPSEYPSDQPPALEAVACTEMGRAQAEVLQDAVRSFLGQAYAECSPGDGQECLYGAVMVAQECLEGMHADSVSTSVVETEKGGCLAQQQAASYCLLRIDHMNNPQKYTRSLQKWAEQLEISGHLYLRQDGSRAKDIAVILRGVSAQNVNSFIVRLRTEYVDVNSKGQKCKERMAQVIHSYGEECASSGGDFPPAGDLIKHVYSNERELHAALDALHVLEKWVGNM